MKPRTLELEDPPEDEAYPRLALIGASIVVYGLYLGSFSADLVRATPSLAVIVASLCVMAMPYALYGAQRFLRICFPRVSSKTLACLALVQVLPFLFLPPRVDALVPALLVLLQGHLLLRSDDPRLAIGSASLGPLFVLVQMAIAPARIWLLGFAISVGLTLISALFLNARESRRWILRRARTRPAAGSSSLGPAGSSSPLESIAARSGIGRAGALRTTLYGLAVAVLLLLIVPFLYLPLLLLPEPMLGAQAQPLDVSELEPEPEPDPSQRGTRQDAQETFQQIFPGDVNFGGGVTPLMAEVVMEVRPVPESPGGRPINRGPLYLRGMVLDTILERGVAASGSSEAVEWRDAADGRRDGWVELPPTSTGEVAYELDILQQPIRVREGSWCVLFGPNPIVGVALPQVLYDPNGLLFDPRTGEDMVHYRLRVGHEPAVAARALASAPERYLQLPRSTRELRVIDALGRDLGRGAGSDRERVERVLAYFQRNFKYSLQSSEFPGLRGVVDFLEQRSGHCTYYAAAATLILRSMKIPTRIATGFLASEWEEDHYVVSTQNGHAWIEVAFEDAGWVAFDPTPAERRAAALAALEGGPDRGLVETAGDLYLDFERWISTGDSVHMEDFAAAVLELPSALWTSMKRSPWITGLVALFLILLFGGRFLPDRSPRDERATPRKRRTEDDLYVLLLRALERHGFRKPSSQTPREFARGVLAGGHPALEPVGPWTERFYRARFGGEDFDTDESGDLRRYIAELRSLELSPPRG